MSASTGFKAQVGAIVTEVLLKLGIISKAKEESERPTAGEVEAGAEGSGAITAEMRLEIQSAVSAQVKPLQEKLTQAQSDLAAAQATIGQRDKELADLKAEAKTVKEQAADDARKLVAGQGVPVAQLPEGVKAGQTTEQQIEALQKDLVAEKDLVKSYEIAAKINALRFGDEKAKK